MPPIVSDKCVIGEYVDENEAMKISSQKTIREN